MTVWREVECEEMLGHTLQFRADTLPDESLTRIAASLDHSCFYETKNLLFLLFRLIYSKYFWLQGELSQATNWY